METGCGGQKLLCWWVRRVCGEWCTLVTDQASEAPEGNGIDTATSWKITEGGGGGIRLLGHMVDSIFNFLICAM